MGFIYFTMCLAAWLTLCLLNKNELKTVLHRAALSFFCEFTVYWFKTFVCSQWLMMEEGCFCVNVVQREDIYVHTSSASWSARCCMSDSSLRISESSAIAAQCVRWRWSPTGKKWVLLEVWGKLEDKDIREEYKNMLMIFQSFFLKCWP